ncbi:MAG: hypothetical protein VW443_10305 [Pseudomonadales bacterium]
MAKVHFVNSSVLQAGDGVGGDDLSQYATINYSDSEDAKIRQSLEEVQSEGRTNTYEVQPTMNAASVGQCVFSNPNGQYTSQGSIQFSATDLSGHSIHWALIKPGNSFMITELGSDDYAVGEVKSVNTSTNTVQVRIFEGEGSPLQGDVLHFGGSPYAAKNDTEENNYLTETQGDAKYAPKVHVHSYLTESEADAKYSLNTHNHTEYSPVGHTHTEYAPVAHTHTEYAPVAHTHDYAASNHDHTPRYMGRFDKTMAMNSTFGSLGSGTFSCGKHDYSTFTTYMPNIRYLKAYGNGFPSATSKYWTGQGIAAVHSTSNTDNKPVAVFQIVGGAEAKNGDATFKVYPIYYSTDYLSQGTNYRLVVSGAWWESRSTAPQIATTEQSLRDELIADGTDPAKIEELVADWEALYAEEANYVN